MRPRKRLERDIQRRRACCFCQGVLDFPRGSWLGANCFTAQGCSSLPNPKFIVTSTQFHCLNSPDLSPSPFRHILFTHISTAQTFPGLFPCGFTHIIVTRRSGRNGSRSGGESHSSRRASSHHARVFEAILPPLSLLQRLQPPGSSNRSSPVRDLVLFFLPLSLISHIFLTLGSKSVVMFYSHESQ